MPPGQQVGLGMSMADAAPRRKGIFSHKKNTKLAANAALASPTAVITLCDAMTADSFSWYAPHTSVPPVLWVGLNARADVVGEKGDDEEDHRPCQGREGQHNAMQESGPHRSFQRGADAPRAGEVCHEGL